MYDGWFREDVNVSGNINENLRISGNVNENLHIWDHRSDNASSTSGSWGTWLALGLGAVGLIAALTKNSKKETYKALPPPQPVQKEKSHFKVIHGFLKTVEEDLQRTKNVKACVDEMNSIIDAIPELDVKFSELEDLILANLVRRITCMLSEMGGV